MKILTRLCQFFTDFFIVFWKNNKSLDLWMSCATKILSYIMQFFIWFLRFFGDSLDYFMTNIKIALF